MLLLNVILFEYDQSHVFYLSMLLVFSRDGFDHHKSYVEASRKGEAQELSNNISDRSEAKGTSIMSDLLLVNGGARQLVANLHYTILLI